MEDLFFLTNLSPKNLNVTLHIGMDIIHVSGNLVKGVIFWKVYSSEGVHYVQQLSSLNFLMFGSGHN